jgi:outer membrane lipoprotein carrier protein
MKLTSRCISYFLLLITLTLFNYAIASVNNKTTNNNTADLNKLLHAVKSMNAEFIQTIYDNHGKEIQKSYGRIALERPGKFRWEVIRPIPQLIVASDDKLWIYDQDLEQVTIRSLQKAAGDAPALLLSQEDSDLENNYNILELQNKNPNGIRWFSFTPKDTRGAMLASTEIGFDKEVVREMKLKDNLGHVTSIKFQQVKTNTVFPHSYFVFKTPKGVDVIDETNRHKQ